MNIGPIRMMIMTKALTRIPAIAAGESFELADGKSSPIGITSFTFETCGTTAWETEKLLCLNWRSRMHPERKLDVECTCLRSTLAL